MNTKSLLLLACLAFAVGLVRSEGPQNGCVVVTGATGFVAGHVIQVLLSKGYTVHGTVRDAKATKKLEHLREMEKKLPGKLVLFETQLDTSESFADATKGCWGMLHLAAVVVAGSTPPEEQVRFNVESTIAALIAAKEASLSSVVVTASTATVSPSKKYLGTKHVYDENDWNDFAAPSYGNYAYAKTRAEKEAQEWVQKHRESLSFRYSTIHFPVGLGPQLEERVTSSNAFVFSLLSGEIPVIAPFSFNIIDIRDVARAHVLTLEHEKASGRYVVGMGKQSSRTLKEISTFLQNKFPSYPIPEVMLPLELARLFALVDGRLSMYDVDIAAKGEHGGFDGSRISRELGFEYQHLDTDQTILDAAESMIALGLAKEGSPILRNSHLPVVAGIAALMFAVSLILFSRMCRRPEKEKKN